MCGLWGSWRRLGSVAVSHQNGSAAVTHCLLSFWVFVAHPPLLAEKTPDLAVKGCQLLESDQTPAQSVGPAT